MAFKNILILFCFLLSVITASAQNKNSDYDGSWQKIDTLATKKGLNASALKEVDLVYAKAKKEGNNAQLIRALIYKINLQQSTDETGGISAIKELDKERMSLTEPARSIVESLEAGQYWSYLQNNRYRFYNRSNTTQFSKTDIATWSIDDFHKKIRTLYLESIREEKILRQTAIDNYNPILIRGNARKLRPFLYDLLAHEALNYFKNDERDVYKPADAFNITDAAAFGDALIFSTHPFNSADTGANPLEALYIYQKLTGFHLNDKDPSALIDLDIDRISFVYSHSTMQNKENLYRSALAEIYLKYNNNPIAAQAAYLLAVTYRSSANLYQPLKDTAHRYDLLKAKKICDDVMKQPDSSEGKSNCAQLLHSILSASIKMQSEIVNPPGQPFRLLVNYKNLATLYVRVLKLDKAILESIGSQSWNDDYWKKLSGIPPLKSFEQPLPDTKDYQPHATEIKMDALPVGEYAVLASRQAGFGTSDNEMVMQRLYISHISYIQSGHDYFVLNRDSGQPIANANVQVWYHYYDSKERKQVTREGENFNTGKNGFFSIPPSKTNANFSMNLEVSTTDDHLFMDEEQPSNQYYRSDDDNEAIDRTDYERKNLKTFLFTDRAIYRPGQLVYFKGIVVTKDAVTRKNKIAISFKTKVYLTDANGGHVDSLNVLTNEFGSYHGIFKLPENRLNGEFSISDDSTGNEQSFSVEEYKRPSFYIEYSELKKAVHLNDSIRVSGSSKAYAGNAVNSAKVSYRVVRNPRFIYPWLFERWGMPRSGSTEITNGTTTTDENGNFTINFKAIPDAAIDKRTEPTFDYQVIADVTDINGETRTAEKRISIGYHSIILSIISPEAISNDSLKNIVLSSRSLSGEPISTTGRLSLFKLKTPDRLIRARYWNEPDQFVMSEKEYHGYFPYDEYSNENEKDNWVRTVKELEWTDSIGSATNVSIGKTRLEPGWYVVVASAKDPQEDSVTNLRYIHIYDGITGNPGLPEYNWSFNSEQVVEPGSKATVKAGSSAKDVFMIQKISRPGESDSAGNYNFLTLTNDQKIASFPIGESDRGGFGVDYLFVKNNRVYINSNSISVPWTNKELNIGYESFRDKTLPGGEEKWKIKISGYKKDKLAAEVLAGMYDASLDQFKPQGWSKPDLYPLYSMTNNWNWFNNFSTQAGVQKIWNELQNFLNYSYTYDQLLPVQNYRRLVIRGMASLSQSGIPGASPVEAMRTKKTSNAEFRTGIVTDTVLETIEEDRQPKTDQPSFQPRKNLNETAFFFPDLKTDSLGNLEFSFTMPEALTQWKWMTLAHTKDLALGYSEKTIVTQKQLMVQPNLPRFLREGDKIEIVTKIVNMTDSELTGQVGLQLFDPSTNEPVDGWFQNMQANQYFTVPAHQSAPATFPIEIPFLYNKPVEWRIMASANATDENHTKIVLSDGEGEILPVLSNRMLVTESLPLNMKGPGKKSFVFDKLKKSGSSETLSQHSVTVEFTSNPAWYAVQALPYLMEYPYECAEQTFNRFYANALASSIINNSPRIRAIFEKWKTQDTAALLSNLQKNQELKSVLLEETPWVLQAKTESEQKRNIALLFDMVKMSAALQSALSKLADQQNASGGFSWFTGGPEDRYITQYILTGIGRLQKLKAIPEMLNARIQSLVKPALAWLDLQILKDYNETLKQKPVSGNISDYACQYLYMRSFFSAYAIPGASFPAINYYRKQARENWVGESRYMQGMIALALYRTGDLKTASDILASLKQNAIVSEELGMYWKENNGGYYWWQAPVETQSLLIEAFTEIGKNTGAVNSLKTWLLKQKQTQNWPTTKATADACYALLLQGSDWLNNQPAVTIQLGDKTASSDGTSSEAGTGYFKKTFEGPFVNPGMGAITVTLGSGDNSNGNGSPAWGSVYWQYFENLDKITTASTPLQLSKKLFISKNTANGPVLEPLADNASLHIGDKVIVRIELRSDRNMEYIHMKDTRASCMEPVNVISTYKWQDGLGYYESTKDASTDFFFSWLPKGTYVFEYPLFVQQAGSFSNGITSIQCMYAPEFSAHSEGIHIAVEALP